MYRAYQTTTVSVSRSRKVPYCRSRWRELLADRMLAYRTAGPAWYGSISIASYASPFVQFLFVYGGSKRPSRRAMLLEEKTV